MTETLPSESVIRDHAQRTLDVRTLVIGLSIGMLAGAFLYFGDPRTGNSEPDMSAETPSHQSGSLAAERDRLEAELENVKLQQQIAELKRELQDSAQEPSPDRSLNDGSATATATLDFWIQMNEIIEREAQLRSAPLGGITSANAGSFLSARLEAAEYAVTSLRALNRDGVDRRAIAVSASLTSWYEQGGRVAQMGRELLTEGSVRQRQGPAGQQYQSAETQLARSVDTVNDEGERVRQQLVEEYGVPFPPLK
jgi:hypothetical protein